MAKVLSRHLPAPPEGDTIVIGYGKGGRNQEFALVGLALALTGASGIDALAADTDGTDGVCDAAGAFVGGRLPPGYPAWRSIGC